MVRISEDLGILEFVAGSFSEFERINELCDRSVLVLVRPCLGLTKMEIIKASQRKQLGEGALVGIWSSGSSK